jgi:hypothetical protein
MTEIVKKLSMIVKVDSIAIFWECVSGGIMRGGWSEWMVQGLLNHSQALQRTQVRHHSFWVWQPQAFAWKLTTTVQKRSVAYPLASYGHNSMLTGPYFVQLWRCPINPPQMELLNIYFHANGGMVCVRDLVYDGVLTVHITQSRL